MNLQWLAQASPPTPRKPLTGPCYFGISHQSSLVGKSGNTQWRSLPNGLLYLDTPPDSTLCNACYHKAVKHGKYPVLQDASTPIGGITRPPD